MGLLLMLTLELQLSVQFEVRFLSGTWLSSSAL